MLALNISNSQRIYNEDVSKTKVTKVPGCSHEQLQGCSKSEYRTCEKKDVQNSCSEVSVAPRELNSARRPYRSAPAVQGDEVRCEQQRGALIVSSN